jgi:hypothetical protein
MDTLARSQKRSRGSKSRNSGSGVVTILYVIQPVAKGRWVIDEEMDRPSDPHCTAFQVDSLVRLPIADPADDLGQTIGLSDLEEIPSNRIADSDEKNSRFYRLLLVKNGKPLGGAI